MRCVACEVRVRACVQRLTARGNVFVVAARRHRYKPDVQELETRLRPFVPDFIPAVGDIDAMIKVGRPDGKHTGLGTEVLDEPSTGQSGKQYGGSVRVCARACVFGCAD